MEPLDDHRECFVLWTWWQRTFSRGCVVPIEPPVTVRQARVATGGWLAGAVLIGLVGTAPAAFSDPLFESGTVLAIRISAPLRTMARDGDDDPEYRGGTLDLLEDGTTVASFTIKIKPRGNSRRDRKICRFPPLRVNFRKREVRSTVFDGQDKLKLVTHCRHSERHQNYVYKEYLAYRMLNHVTDAGFRVRPLTIEYVDTERQRREGTRFGFFIEDEDRLATRLGLATVDVAAIDRQALEPEHASLMDHFQFLIGNTDYSFIAGPEGERCCHNARLLRKADGRYLPMPYDFDMTGFVDPPYARVSELLPIRRVRTRLYRGMCRGPELRDAAVARFQAVRSVLFETVRTHTPLDTRHREKALDYMADFYAILDDPDAYMDAVIMRCRP